MSRIRVDDLHEKWLQDPEYRAEYGALEEEFSLASALISARASAGLTQEQVAKRMNTTQAVVARLESGRVSPRPAPSSASPRRPAPGSRSASRAKTPGSDRGEQLRRHKPIAKATPLAF
jgi:Helix-turn-helix